MSRELERMRNRFMREIAIAQDALQKRNAVVTYIIYIIQVGSERGRVSDISHALLPIVSFLYEEHYVLL